MFCISLVISAAILLYNAITTYHHNQILENSFELLKPDNVYARQEELTIDSLLSIYPPSKNITSGYEPIKRKLDATLHYYSKPNKWIPDYPSYQKGWRVAIPFITKQNYDPAELELKLFYVRTSDVKKIEKALVKKGLVEKGWYLAHDKSLYEEGYYLSPDLYQGYFSFPVKCVICFWLLVMIYSTFFRPNKFARSLNN